MKKIIIKISTLYLIFVNLLICQSLSPVTFVESDEIFANPERGFSIYRDLPVTVALVNNLKQYNVSVIQRIYTIPQFNNSLLSDDFLTTVQNDLNAAREGGAKLVMRFSYTNNQNGEDAPLDIILNQIEQLRPIFQTNYDVIAYIEAGFIGAWGEWYYSSNKLNTTESRRAVLFGLLDALPVDRCVVVRTPNYKRLIFEDNNPITLEEAFNGSKKSRTGAHNDCFLASLTDYGTYVDNDVEGDKDYLNQDNKFVPQGGETCNPSAFSGCDIAPVDLARMHWSILNRDYHPTVLNNWKSEGCYDDVERNLGYRFVLLDGQVSQDVKPGGEFQLELSIVNRGYASPFNPRNLEFILRNNDTGAKYRIITDADPRYWFSGDTVQIKISAGITGNMPEGNYEVLMHLADPQLRLHDRPEFSIRLANHAVWEDSTGYNSLNHFVDINKNVIGNNYTGNLFFLPYTTENNDSSGIIIDGSFGDWENVPQFDVSPNIETAGDATIPTADIVDVWVEDDQEMFYLSYNLESAFSDQLFYHVFFDTDSDTSTGFHSEDSFAGIDLMIENEYLWKYTGQNGEWSWSNYGSLLSEIGSENNNRIELAVPKATLFELGVVDKVEFILNVNDNDDNSNDDYVPNSYKTKSFSYPISVTSVHFESKIIPDEIEISAYPNPFNNSVKITFTLNPKELKSAVIYDSLGRLIYDFMDSGIVNQQILWDGRNNSGDEVVSGVYFFSLRTNTEIKSKKLVLLK